LKKHLVPIKMTFLARVSLNVFKNGAKNGEKSVTLCDE
jgi:hypothetical protein